jgi:serine/threonine protein kinase
LGRDVAVKVLPIDYSANPDRLRRFEHEARAAAALNHPHIVAVFDIGVENSAPYIVQEFLQGDTLRARLNQSAARGGAASIESAEGAGVARAALPVRRALDYAIQIARGMAAAHDKGIVHRDLKPENVFVTNDGQVKILDFGLAKLTQSEPLGSAPTSGDSATRAADTTPGVVLGTMGYLGAGTGARTGGRSPRGCLRPGRRAVRDAQRPARVFWRDRR